MSARHLRTLKIVREKFGDAGVRDPDFLCREFEPGEPAPGRDCLGDGHYLCRECFHFDTTRDGEVDGGR
jgi:hypothetical protein